MSALESLYEHLEYEDPVPLSWVVAHGSDFDRLWSECEDPTLMLKIASAVVPRRDFVIANVALARTVLKFVPKREIRPRVAIETAEGWAAGYAVIENVMISAYEAKEASGQFYHKSFTSNAADAAYYACLAAFGAGISVMPMDYYEGIRAAGHVTNAVLAFASAGAGRREARKKTNIKSARIIREVLSGKVTLGSVVAARHAASRVERV